MSTSTPAKIEVRFRNERTVYSGIVRIIRNAIQNAKYIPKIETPIETADEEGTSVHDIPGARPGRRIPPSPRPTPTPKKPSGEEEQPPTSETAPPTDAEPEQTSDAPRTDGDKLVVQPPQQPIPDGERLSLLDFEGVELKTNLFKTYIVAEAEDKIFFIDQHVAAERVLYERFVHQLQEDGIPVQGLLLPVTLESTPQQLATLKMHSDMFKKLGFDLEEFGGNTILIRAIPSPLPTRAAAQAVTDLLDGLPEAPHSRGAVTGGTG